MFVQLLAIALVLVTSTTAQNRPKDEAKQCGPVSGYVKFDLTYVSNVPTKVYINGKLIVRQQSNYPGIQTVPYSGTCGDLLVHLDNQIDQSPVAFSASISNFRHGHQKNLIFGTRQYIRGFDQDGGPDPIYHIVKDPTLIDVVPLLAKATNFSQPPDEEMFIHSSFPFKDWDRSSIVDAVLDIPVLEFAMLEKRGILPISFQDGNLNKGHFALKIYNTACHPGVDAIDLIE